MGAAALVHKTGTADVDWTAPTCMLCGQAWEILLEEDDRPLEDNKRDALHSTAEQKLPVRPAVVDMLPPGVGMMSGIVPARYVGTKTSDASGSWGCGAFESSGEWIQLKLPESWSSIHITVKELLPIVIGIALWGMARQSAACVIMLQ